MATRSFNEKVVIKDKATLLRLNEALEKPSRFDHIQPITDEEAKKREELAKKWISSR